MSLISEKEFQELAGFNNEVSVSIFIPTQRAGKEVLEEKNKTHLKSLWKEIKNKLQEKEIPNDKIEKLDEPIQQLLNDKGFWRHQSDGLAIYVAEDFFRKFTLPLQFDPYYYINNEFYVKPLVPLFSGDGRFYLLSLQVEHVAFYEASKYSIVPKNIEEMVPSRLEDRVGYDYEEKTLQQKSSATSMGQQAMHGHAGADRERKNEIFRFFRAIDKGLHPLFQEEKLPLLIACQDYLFPIYKEANTYDDLYPEGVIGNPQDTDMLGLHQRAWETIEPLFEKQKREKLDKFQEENGKTAVSIHDILPAIHQGKVDTLFLDRTAEIWGTYNEDNMKVDIQEGQHNGNFSLMNWAARNVLNQGGNVFLVEQEQMPENSSKMNAIYRYS
ncbi:baeRF7 domain-containing protein [Salegentibacter sp. F14]